MYVGIGYKVHIGQVSLQKIAEVTLEKTKEWRFSAFGNTTSKAKGKKAVGDKLKVYEAKADKILLVDSVLVYEY